MIEKHSIKITHEEFVEGFNSGKYEISVNKNKAANFVVSTLADKRNKPAHYFWSWTGILLTFLMPVIFLFYSYFYAFCSFVLGLLIIEGARKSDQQFIVENVLKDQNFWIYALHYGGIIVRNKDGKGVTSIELTELLED
jgi:hypothetical protein